MTRTTDATGDDAQPEKTRKTIERLVAKDESGGYVFVKDIFVHSDEFYGVTGGKAVPVSEQEFERRIEEYKDYEYSPVAHLYDEENTPKGWDEWIGEWERDLYDIVVDSAPSFMWDEVNDLEDSAYDVEHVAGGRIFDGDSEFETVFDEGLLQLVRDIESGTLSADEVRTLIE